jgi:uncharacterized protein (DUF952 family)
VNCIYHITTKAEAESALRRGEYLPADFEKDTFIHCSYSQQIERVANLRFRGCSDLVLLKIDRSRVMCPIIDENLEGGSELFPHIYGPLPREAIVEVLELPCQSDGTFEIPSL